MLQNNLMQILKGSQPEQVPVIITGAGFAAQLVGTSLGEIRCDAAKIAASQVNLQRQTGIDWVIIYSDNLCLYELLGCTVKISPVSGPIIKQHLGDEIFTGLTERDFYESPSCKAVLDAVEIAAAEMDQVPTAVLVEGPFTAALRIYEPARLLKKIIKEPEPVHKLLDSLTTLIGNFALEAKKRGSSIFYIPEPFISKDAVSVKHFRQFAQPHLHSLMERIKSFGGYPILHVCGLTNDRWELMSETGALALSLDQKVSLQQARSVLGPDKILAGNVDPIKTLWRGNSEEVAAEAKQCIADGDLHNFILAPGCAVPPGTPLVNVQNMVKVAKNV